MLYTSTDLESKPGMNGEVDTYTTQDTISADNDAVALEVLRMCAHAVQPIMQRRGWHIKAFHELPFVTDDRGFLDISKFTNTSTGEVRYVHEMSVQLRFGKHSDRLISLKEILRVLCHELAHIEHGDHLVGFFRLNAKLMAELNDDFKEGKVVGWKERQIPERLAHDRDLPNLAIMFVGDLVKCSLRKLGLKEAA
jgi:hypothetical protein